ncbi:MAG: exosortase/archaeosortase family protein [Verrucomicrobiota bacterium]|nr:exosortase/archaeosortase family protein [Verrucomicrobiota bacterium]
MSGRAPIPFYLVPLLLWTWLFDQLHDEWALNDRYNFGWAVPALALLLFYRRWQERPAVSSELPRQRTRGARWILLSLLLPLRLIGEANPDWRAFSWALALTVAVFSIVEMGELGGAAWSRHFAPPILFTLVAVPWPVQFENAVVHGLTRAVAAIAVEAAGWLDIGAYQLGNVIQLANGFVGVDEACSGVKTLQAAIMISVFLGELLALTVARRGILLAAGCVWVFACNILRATTLVVIAARHGIPALERWHDAVGTVVLVAGLAGMGAAAWGLNRNHRPEPAICAASSRQPRKPPFAQSAAAVLWLLVVFAATEIWYRAHERNLAAIPAWTIGVPESFGARMLPIPKATAEILRYNSATNEVWREADQTKWWAFFARWKPKRTALELVRSHSPEICLPAIGRTYVGPQPSFRVDRGDLHLRFATSEFLQQGQPLFVFVCIQADKSGGGEDVARAELNLRGRLRAVWRGERNLGQRLLELAVSGVPDYPSARAAAVRTVAEIVQPSASD